MEIIKAETDYVTHLLDVVQVKAIILTPVGSNSITVPSVAMG